MFPGLKQQAPTFSITSLLAMLRNNHGQDLKQQADTYLPNRNQVYNIDHQYKGVDLAKKKETQRKEALARKIFAAMAESLTADDLIAFKDRNLPEAEIKFDRLLTFDNLFEFTRTTYGTISYNTQQE